MSVLRVLTIIASSWLSLSPVGAHACSCKEPQTLEDAIAGAVHVFQARIVGATVKKPWFEEPQFEIELERIVPYKGGQPSFNVARTPPESSMCGASVIVPEVYWFFTDENGFFTRCGSTQPAYTKDGMYLTRQILGELTKRIRAGE